jgi:nucleoside-diphosphate-sugar epimerase
MRLSRELSHAYSGREVLVTGGAGFIGRALVRALRELGAAVFVVDPRLDQAEEALGHGVAADICEIGCYAMRLKTADWIFNLAGVTGHVASMESPSSDLAANQVGHLALLEGVRRMNPGVRMLFTSTRQVYGVPVYLPVDEQHLVEPIDVNGVHKAACERYHLLYGRRYGIPTAVVRLSNVYGRGVECRPAVSLMGEWFRRLECGESLRIYGDGMVERDFVFVGEVVEGMLRLGAAPSAAFGMAYNLGGPEVWSLREAAGLMCRVAGRSSVEQVAMPSDWAGIEPGSFHLDCRRLERALGWRPLIGLADGVRRTLFGSATLGEVVT